MNVEREKAKESWDKFLDRSSLRTNLVTCSLFIVAWETFSDSTIDYLRGFYNLSLDPSDPNAFSAEYRSRVLDRHKSPLTASLLWFQEMGAIDQGDLDAVNRIRDHRNAIAHELPKYIASADHNVDLGLFAKLIELTANIGRWWVLEVEVPCNSDFDGQEITSENVQSGSMFFLQLLMQVATGDQEEARQMYQLLKQA